MAPALTRPTTRQPHTPLANRRRSTLARSTDQQQKTTVAHPPKARGHWWQKDPCRGGPEARRTPTRDRRCNVITRVLVHPRTRTEPRRGGSMLIACCPFGGAFVVSARTLAPTSCAEAGDGVT
jgi:hypothetical protein